jgi:hypothetical protein
MAPTIIDFSKKTPLQQAREEVKAVIKNDYSEDNSFSIKPIVKDDSGLINEVLIDEQSDNSIDVKKDKNVEPEKTKTIEVEASESENFGSDVFEDSGELKHFLIATPPSSIDIDSPDFAIPKKPSSLTGSKVIGFLAPIFWNAVCFVLGALFIIVLNR